MGSLFEELEARELAARVRVEELEAELAELSRRLDPARATHSTHTSTLAMGHSPNGSPEDRSST